MRLSQIQEQARNLGVHAGARTRKADLIRMIQRAEGNAPCFGADWRFSCAEQACAWRRDCLKQNPG